MRLPGLWVVGSESCRSERAGAGSRRRARMDECCSDERLRRGEVDGEMLNSKIQTACR